MNRQSKKYPAIRALSLAAWVALTSVAVPLVLFPQESQEALTNLARRISEKRAQVESLSDEVQLSKTEYNEELRSLETQIADVETQINREELRLRQVERDLQEARRQMERARTSGDEIAPLVAQFLVQLQRYIRSGLPFLVDERLSEVEELERILMEGTVGAETVLTRTWNLLESEFRLTSESGIYRQTISVDGESQLAEVARLGTVLLFFQTFDDRYGYAVPSGNDWTYRMAESREESQQISNLFDSLRRNLREGYYTIPNPYAQEG